jgi:DNA (cytosine-5)-methyltransferase 1
MGTVLGDLAALGYDAEWEVLSAGDVGSPQERERVWIVAYSDGGRLEERAQLDGGASRHSADRHSRGRHAHGCGGQVGHGDSGRREQHHAGLRHGEQPGAGLISLGDATSARLGAGRSDEGRAIRDDARRSEPERRSGEVGDANREPARRDSGSLPRAESGSEGPRCGARRLAHRPWDAGVPVRGADGTVRLIPREAAEAGPESPFWPVADGLPGRVARLRAIGNTVVPQCVLEGPFRVIAEREAQLNLEQSA